MTVLPLGLRCRMSKAAFPASQPSHFFLDGLPACSALSGQYWALGFWDVRVFSIYSQKVTMASANRKLLEAWEAS